jgi:hypothetical protein
MYKELGEVYIATPYPAVSGGTKDAYNFYHSQLQKQIECTFGILTHRWSILMRAIPMNVSIKKTVTLVLALAILHNYCIDQSDNSDLDAYVANDEWLRLNGAVPLVLTRDSQSTGNNNVIPEQLMDGGHHFDDIGGIRRRYNRQRRYNYISRVNGSSLPRERFVRRQGENYTI